MANSLQKTMKKEELKLIYWTFHNIYSIVKKIDIKTIKLCEHKDFYKINITCKRARCKNNKHTEGKAILWKDPWKEKNIEQFLILNYPAIADLNLTLDGWIIQDDLADKILNSYIELLYHGDIGPIKKHWKRIWHNGFWFCQENHNPFGLCFVVGCTAEPDNKIQKGYFYSFTNKNNHEQI